MLVSKHRCLRNLDSIWCIWQIKIYANTKTACCTKRDESKTILRSHVLCECDLTSKVGTKAAVLKNLHEHVLQKFGEINDSDIQDWYDEAQKYLAKVWCCSLHSSTYDKLR